ncbi:fumarylacetoacetate hydrolase family protein [Pseudomonas chlororaphis]|nr:fumarylacetoacetate hydrolase family protein [Pseudomonas chlororaphis]
MNNFYLATYESKGGPRAAIVVDNQLFDLAKVSKRSEFSSILSILDNWETNEFLLREIAAEMDFSEGFALEATKLLTPLLYPPAVYCAGSNYRDHVENMERKFELPPGPDLRANGGRPFHFLKASRCCVGSGAKVRAPSKRLDWEGELVAVIGKAARNVSIESSIKHVAGYMAGNDLSVRDLGFRPQVSTTSIFHHSFLDHKSFEHSAPIGPWIVPASAIRDYRELTIQTTVNGKIKQQAKAANMIFSLEEQIAYLSSVTTLYPGDIIMTGTPAGAGAETDVYLTSGDEVTVSISEIGDLTTYIV